LIAVTVGCGDNDHLCGPGKTYDDATNSCIAATECGPGTIVDPATSTCVAVCTDGTKLDMATGQCVVDPDDCQAGTVLVNNRCVDPTDGLVVDLDEGSTEPNGYGVIEVSPSPVGAITLKPVGSAFVIHGKIAPFRDLDGDGQMDPDTDSYTLTVSQPTLLEITADGVGGIDGGFVSIAQVTTPGDPLAIWLRFGLNITGDTSKRQVFLPGAATYILTIADTRTLFQYATGGPINAAPGPGDYYVTVKQLAIPTPTAITVTAGAGSASGTTSGDVAFYAAPMGTGLNDVKLVMPALQTNSALAVTQNNAFRNDTYAGVAGGASEMFIGGFQNSDNVVIAADAVWNYATSPAAYTLSLRTSDATPLSTSGGMSTQTEPDPLATGSFDVLSIDQFFLDVSAPGQIDGINLSWNHAVSGGLYDGNLNLLARFTNFGSGTTWTSYTGLLRFPTAGRYYFFVYDNTGTPNTTQLTATSRIDAITPSTITEGTTTGSVALDANYGTNVFTYTAGTDPWQKFDSTGTNTGGQNVAWFDPATTYGRLDKLTTNGGTSGPTIGTNPLNPIFQHAYTTTGGAVGRILLDDPTPTYLVKVNAVGATSSPAFTLLFDKRTITDFGMLAANGTGTASTNHTIDNTTTVGYFLFRTGNGNLPTIDVHPQNGQLLLNTEFTRLNADESGRAPSVNNATTTGDDTESYVQTGNGWTAFVVQAVTPPATAQMYDVTVAVDPPVSYSEAASATAFASICGGGGGTNITFVQDNIGVAASDDGTSVAFIGAPSGFLYYGQPVANFKVSTNGWLSFDGATSSAPNHQDMPNAAAPNNLVAPYWADLHGITACTKAVGTTVTVQWDGLDANNAAVHMQAILDSATNSVTFLWDSTQTALGGNATIGIEDAAGANATKHSYNTANAITAGSGRTFTPM